MATGKILRFDEVRGYGFIAPDSGGEDVFLHANALLAEKHQYHPGVPVEFEVIEGERGLKATAVRVLRNRPSGSPDIAASSGPTSPASPASPASPPGPPGPAGPTAPGAPAATPLASPATPAVLAAVVRPAPVPSPAMQAPATHGPSAQPQPSSPGTVPSPAAQPHSSSANGSVATAAPPTAVTPAAVTPSAVTPSVLTPSVVNPPVVTPATVAAATSHGAASIAPQRASSDSGRAVREVVSPDALGTELVELCLESVPSMTGEQITQLRRAVVTMARRHGWVND